MFKAAIVLSQEYNITIEGQHIEWKSAQTEGDVINALSNTCQLISTSSIVGIVGPELSRESHFIAPFAAKIRIPVISYGATDPELSDRNAYPAFYRTVPSDNAAALAIVKLFLLFNWTSCLIIYQNDAFGLGGTKTITETFNKNNLTVTQMIVFDISTHTIRDDLKSLLTSSSTRIILVWAEPEYTTLILQNALDNDVVGPRFTWILNSNIQLNSFNSTFYDKLIGMLIVEPVVGNVVNATINETLLNKAYGIWKKYEPHSFPEQNNVDYYALFAFDATWTLIQSLQEFCSKMIQNSGSCISFNKTSSCFDRQLFNSSSLFNAINNMRFLGVSGSIEFDMNVTDRINGTYYVAKNVHGVWKDLNNNQIVGLNSNPVLVWSETNGWISHRQANVIIWPGNTLKAPSGYASISGITLRIAIIESPPFTIVPKVKNEVGEEIKNEVGEEIKKFVGYVPDLIELLQKKMGFNSSITLVPSHETYNILVDAVEKGVYDMVVADMTVTAGRMKKVDFSSAIFDNSLRIIVREASSLTNIDLLSYLRPFSFNVWIALLFATLYAGFLICLLEREHNEALRNKSISSLIVKSMWYSLGTILGFGVDFNIRTPTGRLLTIGLYILSLVSVSAYTAKLAAELTIAETKRSMISGIDDIKNGKIPFNRIGILTNTSIQDYYLREFSGSNLNFYPLESEQEMYDKLLDNTIDASIMDSGFLEYATSNIYCNLTLIGADFDKSAFGIAFQKNWLYQEVFNLNILSLRESGDLDELKRKWFQTNYCSHLSPIFTSMTIESMAGLFITFGTISIFAILLFIWKKRFIIIDYLLFLKHRKDILENKKF
jgi:ABC-type amino acid transport substrate-binding protein/ABC-type branched-subunit amino acid transport system substrate-binding protein